MKSLNIYAFADEASPMIDDQIVAMKRNHLQGLEMRNVDNENVSDITVQKAREVKKKLQENGLITWSIGSPIGKIDIEKDDFNQHLEKFKHTLEIAHELEAENIRLFSFYIPKNRRPEDYKNEVIERMGQFVEIASGSNVCLCHENEKGIYGDNAERCHEILTSLPQLKGIFDPANFVQCNQDTIQAWNLLHPYIKYLHIKDAYSDGRVVPAGKGIGNVFSIMSSYYNKGGNALTIEPHLAVFQGLSELEREKEQSVVGEYIYPDNDTAFDVACQTVQEMIERYGIENKRGE